jgi:serine protease
MKTTFQRLSLVFALSASLVAVAMPTQAQAPEPITEAPVALLGESGTTDQIIIKYRAGGLRAGALPDGAAHMRDVSDSAGESLSYKRSMSSDRHVLKLGRRLNRENLNRVIAKLAARADVESVEADELMFPTLTPNDPSYSQQWHYFGTWGANLPGAWDITTGNGNVTIAVIDTGYRPHADLAGRIVQGYDFIGDSQVANDGGGRDTDASDPGDWITSAESASGYFQGCQVRNSSWHGTHVAGTIGAVSNNGVGVAGINWNAKILPARVLGKCGGYTSDIADAIRWSAGLSVSGVPANANPAKVLNLSLGGSGACGSTSAYQLAINDAVNAGAVVAVAAGNSNANAANYSPASCANVITVASTGPTGNRAYYSNYGATVEIAAPGGDTSGGSTNGVLSTLNTGTTVPASDSYAWYQGTSMATPHVAGIVSLLFTVNPSLTPSQVTQILQQTVTAFPVGGTCTTSNCGPGIINAAAAVAQANGGGSNPPGAFNKSAPANGATNQATSLTLSWGASTNATSYEYCIDTNNNNACDATWTNVGNTTSTSVSGLTAGTTYYWQSRASNTNGTVEADGGTWWSFSTSAGSPPGAFNKISPSSGSRPNRPVTLSWGASSGATSYEYCVDTSKNNSCDTSWVNVGSATSTSVSGLSAGIRYYWQVRAVNANGTTNANGGSWWNFRPR